MKVTKLLQWHCTMYSVNDARDKGNKNDAKKQEQNVSPPSAAQRPMRTNYHNRSWYEVWTGAKQRCSWVRAGSLRHAATDATTGRCRVVRYRCPLSGANVMRKQFTKHRRLRRRARIRRFHCFDACHLGPDESTPFTRGGPATGRRESLDLHGPWDLVLPLDVTWSCTSGVKFVEIGVSGIDGCS